MFLAYCPDLVGCSATGRSREEAIQRLQGRVECLLEGTQIPARTGGTLQLAWTVQAM